MAVGGTLSNQILNLTILSIDDLAVILYLHHWLRNLEQHPIDKYRFTGSS